MSRSEYVTPQWGGARPGSGRPQKYKSKTVAVSVSLPADLVAKLDRAATKRQAKRSELVAELLAQALKGKPR